MSAQQGQVAHSSRSSLLNLSGLAVVLIDTIQNEVKRKASSLRYVFAKRLHHVLVRFRDLKPVITKRHLAGGVDQNRNVFRPVTSISAASKKERFPVLDCACHCGLNASNQKIGVVEVEILAPESISEFPHLVSLSLGALDRAGVNSSEPSDKGERGASGYVTDAPKMRGLR